MTISYTGDVANASSFGCFNKILFKWKGSVYKLIYKVGNSIKVPCTYVTCNYFNNVSLDLLRVRHHTIE